MTPGGDPITVSKDVMNGVEKSDPKHSKLSPALLTTCADLLDNPHQMGKLRYKVIQGLLAEPVEGGNYEFSAG